jgi:hypothetical protein
VVSSERHGWAPEAAYRASAGCGPQSRGSSPGHCTSPLSVLAVSHSLRSGIPRRTIARTVCSRPPRRGSSKALLRAKGDTAVMAWSIGTGRTDELPSPPPAAGTPGRAFKVRSHARPAAMAYTTLAHPFLPSSLSCEAYLHRLNTVLSPSPRPPRLVNIVFSLILIESASALHDFLVLKPICFGVSVSPVALAPLAFLMSLIQIDCYAALDLGAQFHRFARRTARVVS